MKALLTTITITRVTRREPSSRRSPQRQRGPNHGAPLPLTMHDEWHRVRWGRHYTFLRQWCKAITFVEKRVKGPQA